MRDKTETPAVETSEHSLPFFARFLEGQDASKNSFQTLKYPSDRDEIDQHSKFMSGQQRTTALNKGRFKRSRTAALVRRQRVIACFVARC